MSRSRTTAEQADDHISEHGTGGPKTLAQLQAMIVGDIAEETDRRRGLIAQEALRTGDPDERTAYEEAADILRRRRDALYAAASALQGLRNPEWDRPLTAADYGAIKKA